MSPYPEAIGMCADVKELKKKAAETAVDRFIKDGMVVGLGTGSTAYYAILRIAELVSKKGFNITCVATSEASASLARENGLKVVDISEVEAIDVTIDGADEVDPNMNLIKGLGGALLREKIVAAATIKEVIIVDESKLVDRLGTKAPLPVEVVRFGHSKTAFALRAQGSEPVLRMSGDEPFVTDGGNYIYDCRFTEGISKGFFLQAAIDSIPGVVECGMFLNMTAAVVIAHSDGKVEVREAPVSEGIPTFR